MNEMIVATVGSADESGVTLILPGSASPTQKRYKRLITGETLAADDLVLAVKTSGTFVVLGKIAYS